jgi:hypothetical protein
MCDVSPEGKGWDASLIVTLRHLPSFSSDACFSSKPPFRYTSSRALKITQPSGSTTRTSSSSAWGVVRCEDPHADGRREGAASKPRGSPNTMRCRPWYASAFSGGVLGFLSASARIYPDSSMIVLSALLALTFTTVGAFVASRRPENSIGWIFCAGGFVLSVAVSATNYAEYALQASTGSLPGVQYAA